MTKKEAAKLLMEKYLDEYDRVKLSLPEWANSMDGAYENSNMLLFSGEALILLKKNGLLTKERNRILIQGIYKCELQEYPGLFSRHPMPYRIGPHFDVISHDEYNGIMYAAVATDRKSEAPIDVVRYGEKHGYTYCDLFPGTSFLKEFIRNPTLMVKNIIKMYKLIKNDENYRFKVGPAELITYKRMPRDIAFYQLVANGRTSLFNLLFMCLSTILSTYQATDYKEGSGRMMALYRIWALEMCSFNKITNLILNVTHKIFRKRCIKQYGENYVETLHHQYFTRDENHPFLELCKGLK